MKKIIMLMGIIGFFAACDMPNEDKFEADSQSGWINIVRDTVEVNYTSILANGVPEVALVLNAPVNENGIDVTYKIEAIPAAGANQVEVPAGVEGTFTQKDAFPAGSLTGSLKLSLSEIEPGKFYQLKLTLIDTNAGNLRIGLEGHEDDAAVGFDYPTIDTLNVGQLATAYEGTSFFNGTPRYQFTPVIAPVEGSNGVYEMDTAWGLGFLPSLNASLPDLPYDAMLIFNSNGSVTIAGNAPYASGGSGHYHAETGEIHYTLTQKVSVLAPDVKFDVELVPVN